MLSLSTEHLRRCRANPDAYGRPPLTASELWYLARRNADRERSRQAEHDADPTRYGCTIGNATGGGIGVTLHVAYDALARQDIPPDFTDRAVVVFTRKGYRGKPRPVASFYDYNSAAAWFEEVARNIRGTEHRAHLKGKRDA